MDSSGPEGPKGVQQYTNDRAVGSQSCVTAHQGPTHGPPRGARQPLTNSFTDCYTLKHETRSLNFNPKP